MHLIDLNVQAMLLISCLIIQCAHFITSRMFAHNDVTVRFHQGPALYAYNDATFKADDWKGIRMLQDSIKKDDPLKVGRFGLGFKSVFHMTGECSDMAML